MEVQLRRRAASVSTPVVLMLVCATMLVMLPEEASATRFIVGGKYGWTSSPNVNYTVWASDKHFYLGDWLFFVYDRNMMNVLEVNKTDYETCNSDHPIHSWTTGAGRDVVPLNVTKNYYFISGKGFCYGGMKVAIHVEKVPPPPKASPVGVKNGAPSASGRQIVLRAAIAFVAVWASLFRFC